MMWRSWMYPELERLATAGARSEVLRAARSARGAQRGFAAAVILFSVISFFLVALGCGALVALLGRPFQSPAELPDRLLEGTLYLSAGAGLAVGAWLYRRRTRRIIREILNQRGVLICVPCGYDLTGNVSGRCPECGVATPVARSVAQPPQGPAAETSKHAEKIRPAETCSPGTRRAPECR